LDKYRLELFDSTKTNCGSFVVVVGRIKIKIKITHKLQIFLIIYNMPTMLIRNMKEKME
jgi:hypothetical protein